MRPLYTEYRGYNTPTLAKVGAMFGSFSVRRDALDVAVLWLAEHWCGILALLSFAWFHVILLRPYPPICTKAVIYDPFRPSLRLN